MLHNYSSITPDPKNKHHFGPVDTPILPSAAEHPMRFEYRTDKVEHALGVAARRDLVESARDALVGVEHRGRTRRDPAAEHTKGACQFAVGVREQDEREGVLFGKG